MRKILNNGRNLQQETTYSGRDICYTFNTNWDPFGSININSVYLSDSSVYRTLYLYVGGYIYDFLLPLYYNQIWFDIRCNDHVRRPHPIIQSVIATDSVYEKQEQNQCEPMTHTRWKFNFKHEGDSAVYLDLSV